MDTRLILVTHHAPDLDAIGAIWLFKRFDSQHYANAKVAFVNPGATLQPEELEALGSLPEDVTYVDTGLGEFDHHQPERGSQYISASSLVLHHIWNIHPDRKNDQALKELVAFITEIDHFGEIKWPEAGHLRYSLMIHELIYGRERVEPHDDDSQLHFGLQCLDASYAVLSEEIAAKSIIAQEGIEFETTLGKCLALNTANSGTVKRAQKQGYMLVIRKDPHSGHVVIKARPDSAFILKDLAEQILQRDTIGTWYYHPSGKMFLNGSRKHRDQKPSRLSLEEIIALTVQTYGTA